MDTERRPRLFLQTLGPEAWRFLQETVAMLKGDDPLAPATVVVPSAYARLRMRHILGRRGMVNVHFLLPPQLSELLGAPSLAARGLRPLTPLLEGAAVRAIAAEAPGPLDSLRDHPALHHSLRSTFRELRHAGEGVLQRLEGQSGLRPLVVRLYRRFRDLTAEYYDREDLAQSAAEAARERPPGLKDLGPVVFYLLPRMTPSERALVEALAESWSCFVILGVTGDEEADEEVLALVRRVEDALGPAQDESPDGVPAMTHLVIAPDAHEEVRWCARHIARAAQEGVPFHRMAVLYRHDTPYASLVAEELALAGIPTAGPGTVPLSDTAVGRTLTGLVGLADGELPRDTVMEWLTGCPVSPPQLPGGVFHASQWDAISRRAGVVRGLEQWQTRLDMHATRMERLVESEVPREGLSEARAAWMANEAEAARQLASFIEGLSAEVKPPEDGHTWQELAGWARGLLERYLERSAGLPEVEEDALTRINDGLEELSSLDALEPGASLERFALALDELLSARVGHQGKFGEGVFVAPLYAALGMEFDTVHVLGLVEGMVPPRASDDPLIPDAERRTAGGPSSGLPLRGARRGEERYNYLAALASAPQRILSFPRGDPAARREQYASRWFLEEASRLNGSPVFSSTLAGLGQRPWLTAIASVEEGLGTARQEAPADLHDYDLYNLWRWRASGNRLDRHHLAASGPFSRALALERQRAAGLLGQWDGDLTPLAGKARRLGLLKGRVLSATSLQAWAACPFRYFLGHVLGLAALERPEELLVISPLERGSLVHSVLEQFMRQVQERDALPGPTEPWTEEHRALLFQIARHALEEAEGRGVTGKELLWELEKEDILADLVTFLEEDARLRAHFGVTPSHVEMKFGFSGGEPAAAPAALLEIEGLGALRFRGIIDRVDLAPAGQRVLVLDYKTGSRTPYETLRKDPVDGGRLLQLPIYSLAVRQALGKQVRVQASYWFVTARGGFSLLPPVPLDLEEAEERFGQAVAVIARGILQGLFPANPGVRDRESFANCRWCDFDSLCPARRDVYWERKRGDLRLAPYLGLSAGAAPGEASG